MPTLPTPELCISGRDLGEPRLSPDGSIVAFTVSWGGRAAIAVVPSTGGPERLVTTVPDPRPGRGGGSFDWAPDGSAIVYAAQDGNLWWQPVPGGAATPLTAVAEGAAAQAPAVSADGRRVAYVVDLAELWVAPVHVPVGESDGAGPAMAPAATPVAVRVETRADFVVDPAWSPDGRLAWHEWSVPSMAWDESCVRVIDLVGADETVGAAGHQAQQPRFGSDERLWCLRDDTGWLNVWVEDQPVVDERHEHGGPTWGPGQRSFAVAPDGRSVAFARNEDGFGRLCVGDPESGDVRELGRGVHTQVSWAGERIAALRSGAVTPGQIVSYDVSTGQRTVLAYAGALGWDAVALVEPELVAWESGDGAEIHGRLYRPPAAEGAGPGAEPAPMICWVHGGPTDQWPVGFLPRVAFWVARGWTVLVPDFRGSTGHGRAYQQAMRHGWGVVDVADVAAGIRHAHRRGWASPGRTVLMGGSAGGFTVLHLAASEPALGVAACVSYPVTDLVELDATTHRFEAHYNASIVGPRPAADDEYHRRSPVTFADRIAVPLLVLHGDRDPVVGVDQSRSLVDRVAAAGGSAELVVYEGEGHGFRSPANQLDEYRRVEAFLARHL